MDKKTAFIQQFRKENSGVHPETFKGTPKDFAGKLNDGSGRCRRLFREAVAEAAELEDDSAARGLANLFPDA